MTSNIYSILLDSIFFYCKGKAEIKIIVTDVKNLYACQQESLQLENRDVLQDG